MTGSGRNFHTAKNYIEPAAGVAAVVAAAVAVGQRSPHFEDCPEDLDGTVTYSGTSNPNVAPSPITYHPCARTARKNVFA